MEIMRGWRVMETQTSVQTKVIDSNKNYNGEFTNTNNILSSIIIDPKEGTSKQFNDTNQSIYNGPIVKKTPSTPECEEVLEELRKQYYNPREGSSKQYENNNSNINNKTPTINKTPENECSTELLYETYKKRFVNPIQESNRTVGSSENTLELLRSCIQYAFDQEVDIIVKKFVQLYFVPAMKNLKENLGESAVSDDIICSICVSLIENSKLQYMCNVSSADTLSSEVTSISTATTPKMELSESESSDNSQNVFTGSILQQALKRKRVDESPSTTTEEDTAGDEISDDILGKIAEEISEEDLSQAFSFEDSLLSDIPCLSLSPPPLMMDTLNTDTTDFKVPLPPIETIKGVCAPFSSLFVPSTNSFSTSNTTDEQCFDFIDFDFIE
uniref:CSON007590 protein n=1 Tax=Culicoides sonorensis TaxID=179676 RepID=A0A336MUW6_CULSO